MIRKNQKLINRLNVLSDGVLVVASYLFASWMWLGVIRNSQSNMASVSNFNVRVLGVAVIYAAWTAVMLSCFKVYRTTRIHHSGWEGSRILAANAVALTSAAAALYVFRLEDFSRGVLAVYYLTSCLILTGKRFFIRRFLRYMRAKGFNLKHMLVVGGGILAQRYIDNVQDDPSLGIHVDEHLIPGDGLLTNLEEQLHGNGIDEVIMALAPDELYVTMDVICICEKCGTKISVIPFYNDVIPTCPTIDTVGSIKLIQLRTTPLDDPLNAFLKRAFDVMASIVLMFLLSPLLLILAVIIRLSSPGPVLFRQERVGLKKAKFIMYKFRSMRVNPYQNTAWSSNADSRRTRVGSLLRKTSLDELPQLINVLKGDMSLVGPRPEIPYYVEQFRETVPLYMVKCQVRPGMTGWAQINGLRGDTSIPDRVAHDLWYIENWSFGLDMKILLKTLFGGMINRETLGRGQRKTKAG